MDPGSSDAKVVLQILKPPPPIFYYIGFINEFWAYIVLIHY